MTKSQTIPVRTGFDLILARKRTREIAQAVGLTMPDQARIALSASSIGQALELDTRRHGEIVIDAVDGDGNVGVRVVCTTNGVASDDPILKAFNRWEWKVMVDDLTVETIPPDTVQVTAIKWSEGIDQNW